MAEMNATTTTRLAELIETTTKNLTTTVLPTLLNLNGYLDNDMKFWIFWISCATLMFALFICLITYCMQVQEEHEVAVAAVRQSRDELRRERAVNEQLRWHQRILCQKSNKGESTSTSSGPPTAVTSAIVITMPRDEDMSRSRFSGEPLSMTPVPTAMTPAPILKTNRVRYARVNGAEKASTPLMKSAATSTTNVTFSNIDLNDSSVRLPSARPQAAVHQRPAMGPASQSNSNSVSFPPKQNTNRGFIGFSREF